MRDKNGKSSLMHLFTSMRLDDFDFGCRRFRELLQRQCDWVGSGNLTVLMHLCNYNPQLLRHYWAVGLVRRLGGRLGKGGKSHCDCLL